MIPKIIHYCWFGRGEKPELGERFFGRCRVWAPPKHQGGGVCVVM